MWPLVPFHHDFFSSSAFRALLFYNIYMKLPCFVNQLIWIFNNRFSTLIKQLVIDNAFSLDVSFDQLLDNHPMLFIQILPSIAGCYHVIVPPVINKVVDNACILSEMLLWAIKPRHACMSSSVATAWLFPLHVQYIIIIWLW